MKIVVQRSKEAQVEVSGDIIGKIPMGLVILVGITHDDTDHDARYLADKVAGLRIFDDENGKMNLSVKDVGGNILSISQFTLYGDTSSGRRPSYTAAARPDHAQRQYDVFNQMLRDQGLHVETGQFGAMMDVTLTNWGPVTLIIDSNSRNGIG